MSEIIKTKSVSYLRCSGESQKEGDTWDRQNLAIAKFTAANGIEIVSEFRDQGVTGKMELEGRTGLSACIAYVQEQGIKLVVCESSDRLARDLIVAEVIVREFQKIGVRVMAASAGIDLTAGDDSNPTGKLIRQILAAVAEFDRCVTVLKLKGARDRIRAEKGKCDGRKSFGEKPEEIDTLMKIKAMSAADYSCKRIADVLNMQGAPSRSGKKWLRSVVAKIIARERKKAA